MKEYRAGIYLRLSKQDNEKNNSIETQREITTNYAISRGYKIVKEYADNGYSGILNSRPKLNEMMLDIVKGFINMVIVKDVSRLTRDKNKTGWYTEIFFPDNDVRFISVTEFIDSGEKYEIDDGIMLRGIANQSYIEDISKKVRANKNAMKEEGKYVEFLVPYGYKKETSDKHKIIIDENVANNVRKIYKMYLEGYSSGEITQYFNNQKVKTPSKYMKLKNAAKRWNSEQICNILSNQFYIGNTVMNKYETNYIKKTCKKNNKENWIIKENTHQAIIKKEDYEKVQEIKAKKRKSANVKYEYLLMNLVYCGNCKRKLQYKIYKSKNKELLHNSAGFICNYFYRKKCKNGTYIKEKALNEIVKKEVIKMLCQINVNDLTKYYKKMSMDSQKMDELKRKEQELENKKSILYNKKCEGYITAYEFKIEYEKLKEEIEKCKLLINRQNVKRNNYENKLENIMELFKKENYITNNFLKEIISKIEIYSENKIEIFFKQKLQ